MTWFWVERSKVNVRVTVNRHTTFELYECLLVPTPTLSVSVSRIFESVCLSVCPQHNSKANDAKVFKLGIGNDHGIS